MTHRKLWLVWSYGPKPSIATTQLNNFEIHSARNSRRLAAEDGDLLIWAFIRAGLDRQVFVTGMPQGTLRVEDGWLGSEDTVGVKPTCSNCGGKSPSVRAAIGGPFTEVAPWTTKFPYSPVPLCGACRTTWKAVVEDREAVGA